MIMIKVLVIINFNNHKLKKTCCKAHDDAFETMQLQANKKTALISFSQMRQINRFVLFSCVLLSVCDMELIISSSCTHSTDGQMDRTFIPLSFVEDTFGLG